MVRVILYGVIRKRMMNESAYFATMAASIQPNGINIVNVEIGDQILIVQCKRILRFKYEGLEEKNYIRGSIWKVMLFKMINVGDA